MMGFKELLNYLREQKISRDKSNHKFGTYVSVHLDEKSINSLDKWCDKNKIENASDPTQYHSTVIYSRKGIPDIENYNMAMPLSGSVSHLTKFGKCLVAIVDCPELEEYHDDLVNNHGATHDYDDYHPHVTLSYDYSGDVKDLVAPKTKIVYHSYSIEPLDPHFTPKKKTDK